MNVLYIYLLLLCLFSVATFFCYAADKQKAKKGKWRIAEKTLLCLGFLGGGMGGLLGMTLFRHKTKHGYFYAVNLLGLVWQVVVAYYLCMHPIII